MTYLNLICRLITFFIVVTILIKDASSVNIECDFYREIFANVGEVYTCLSETINIVAAHNREITKISGYHLGSLNNQNVEGFFVDSMTVRYFPRNLGEKFSNLKAICLFKTDLKEIHQNDLETFGDNLQYIDFSFNSLEYLEDGLFEKNKNLKVIYFQNNRIKVVHENVFDNLDHLLTLNMKNNECTDGNTISNNKHSKTLEIISKIKQKCSKGYDAYAVSHGINNQ